MKKLVLVLLAAVLIVSCQKKEQNVAPQSQDLVFGVLEVDPNAGLKSTEGNWDCKDLLPNYAEVKISGVTYYPKVFRLQSNGRLYTQAIKLEPGNYNVQRFILWHDTDGDNDPDGDQIVMATPKKDTEYAPYVTEGLNIPITVGEFTKLEYNIDVLCFQEHEFESFGFDWFEIGEIVIRQQCFFGDICIDDPTEYAGSIYDDVDNGVMVDEEAAIRVIVKNGDDEVPYSPFDNLEIYGTGQVLCVDYPDNLNIDDEEFTFEVQVWVPSTTSGEFVWQTYATYSTTDADPLAETDNDQDKDTDNDDGVVDFAIGTCSPDSYPLYPWLGPEDPPEPTGCETAFAYDATTAQCFLDLTVINANRWGWTNGPFLTGTHTLDIYAAAGQCNLSSGTHVGTLSVRYEGSDVTVTYTMFTGFTMTEAQIYVGNEILPRKNGNYTVAPGQYPHVNDELENVPTYFHTFTGMTDGVYVVAHAVVCGF